MVKKEQIDCCFVNKFSMNPEKVYALQQVISSYMGHFKHANTWNLVNHIFERYVWLSEHFFFVKGKLFSRFKHKGVFRTLRSQVNFFKCRFPLTILFFQVGKYFETYGKDALDMSTPLKIKIRHHYRGMEVGAGFPKWMLPNFIGKTLSLGRNVAIIKQSEVPGFYVRERFASELYRLIE
ncbi:MAG: hypothetical protein K8S13_02835 [Desulfobacula sp.]|uniref:hypothetical protein n=1 Tax=Desulfobacula sp. TaxID=2593537 RepID=UPI0025C66FF6|nr:hypothetical protein [Desulfobacula sp.]MCD4718780.1 hypothetical protein [Desulfobacula sp.]